MNYRKSEAKEASRAQFHGLWAAITTPFTPDLEVDEAGLRRNMRHLTDNLHIKGVFCTGVMGEYWSLTKEERKRIVEVVVEEAKGKCKVIAHTAHHSAHETVELTRHAEEVGADFAVMINPYFPPVNESMVYDWFSFVASRVNIGIWMFDAYFAGYGLSAGLTERIARIENVCGIKIPRPMDHYVEVLRRCGSKIVVSHPSEDDWLMLIRDHGQQVHMSSPSPYVYQTTTWQPLTEYTDLALSGRFAEAEPIAKQLTELRQIDDRWLRAKWRDERIIPIHYLKAWCEALGMAGGPVRPPLPQITDDERARLRAELEKAGLLARVPAATRG